MNIASKYRATPVLSAAFVAVLFFICIIPGYAAAADDVASQVPDPSVQPLADPVKEVAEGQDSPDNYVSEGNTGAQPLSSDEALKLLQSGNNGHPLSIADLALINDAMTRIDYAAQLQKKLAEANGSNSSASGAQSSPVTAAPMPSGASGLSPRPYGDGTSFGLSASGVASAAVVRVFAVHGAFKALVAVNGSQTVVSKGDTVAGGRVADISLSGVKLDADSGSTTLPFVSPVAGLAR